MEAAPPARNDGHLATLSLLTQVIERHCAPSTAPSEPPLQAAPPPKRRPTTVARYTRITHQRVTVAPWIWKGDRFTKPFGADREQLAADEHGAAPHAPAAAACPPAAPAVDTPAAARYPAARPLRRSSLEMAVAHGKGSAAHGLPAAAKRSGAEPSCRSRAAAAAAAHSAARRPSTATAALTPRPPPRPPRSPSAPAASRFAAQPRVAQEWLGAPAPPQPRVAQQWLAAWLLRSDAVSEAEGLSLWERRLHEATRRRELRIIVLVIVFILTRKYCIATMYNYVYNLSITIFITCYEQRAKCYVLFATCYVLRTTCDVRNATCYKLRATCYVAGATCYVLRATCYVLRATSDVRRAESLRRR